MKPDLELIQDCLATGRVEEETAIAFGDMAWSLETGAVQTLTAKQRAWVVGVAGALGLEALGTENMISTGKVTPTKEELAGVQEFLKSLGPKLLKPPGRVGR